MKKLMGLTMLIACVSLGFSQQAKEKSALQSMVDTELAFARMAAEQGIRPSFMAFIAEDGILFRPRAVKGKQWMIDHPLPPSDKHPLLSWYPAVAEIAAAGDMGYTTGPWEFRQDINDAKAVAFGNFLTVWKLQADGSWKFAIDLGISNPQAAEAIEPWQMPNNYLRMAGGIGPGTSHKKQDTTALLEREREFSRDSISRGARLAFEDHAHRDVRLFRNGQQPMRKADAGAFLGAGATNWTWEPAFADVSSSGDLGYSYGTYRIASKDAPSRIVESGNYYRVWKKPAGKWLVVADLTDPVSVDKKN
jgi:ketosteroid isomerase-like protein